MDGFAGLKPDLQNKRAGYASNYWIQASPLKKHTGLIFSFVIKNLFYCDLAFLLQQWLAQIHHQALFLPGLRVL